MFVTDMKGLRVGLVTLLLLGALYVHFNSEIVDEWASNRVNDDVDNGLQL